MSGPRNSLIAVLAIACACAYLHVLEQADFLVEHVEAAALEEVAALAADERHRDVAAIRRLRLVDRELQRRLGDVGVEAAAQAAVGGDHDQQRARRQRIVVQQRVRRVVGARRQVVEDPEHFLRVRTAAQNAFLRAAQLRGRDHLHGLRDLLRRLDRANAPTNVDQ